MGHAVWPWMGSITSLCCPECPLRALALQTRSDEGQEDTVVASLGCWFPAVRPGPITSPEAGGDEGGGSYWAPWRVGWRPRALCWPS